MGDKPRHWEQSSHAVTPMYFSPRDDCIQILHQLHMEMGLLSSPVGMFTSANHILFNKALLCSQPWWKTAASGQGFGSTPAEVVFPQATAPSFIPLTHSLSAPTNRSKTDSRMLRWTGSVQQSKMTISAFFIYEAIVLCSTCPVLLGAISVCPPHLLRASHHTGLGNKSLLPHKKLFRQNIFLHRSFPRFQDWMGCFGLFSPKATLSTGLGFFNLYWCSDSLLHSGFYFWSHRAAPLIMFLLCVQSCKTAPTPKQ